MQPPPPRKLKLAQLFGQTGLSRLLLSAQNRLRMPYIRIVNYHDVPLRLADQFAEQLEFFAQRFEPIGFDELTAFLEGRFHPKRPGLMLTFDDGLKSHIEVVAPRLQSFGFPGWFAVPAEFPDLRVDDDEAFRRERLVDFDSGDFAGGPLLSWDDVRRLDQNHVVSCHSFTHRRLSADMTDEECAREIHDAKARLEEQLGHAVRSFVWVGGEEWAYSAKAAQAIRDAGFELSLMTNYGPTRPGANRLQLQRTNFEAEYPLDLVQLGLSGLFDVMYWPKRRRVNRVTATG